MSSDSKPLDAMKADRGEILKEMKVKQGELENLSDKYDELTSAIRVVSNYLGTEEPLGFSAPCAVRG